MNGNGVGLTAAVFAVVGAGVGLVAAATTGWAETALAAAATGETARFGPVFVAQSYLAITAAALVIAPLLAGVLGLLVGSGRGRTTREAAATCGIGGGLGALAYGLVVVVLVVASQGEAATQARDRGRVRIDTHDRGRRCRRRRGDRRPWIGDG